MNFIFFGLLALMPVSEVGVQKLQQVNDRNEARALEQYERSLYRDHHLYMSDVYSYPSNQTSKQTKRPKISEVRP